MTFPENRPEDICARFELVIGTFDHLHRLSKAEFIEKLFQDAFKVIPEAEKGSYYELIGDRFVPVCAKGYDMDVLSRLSFDKDSAFIDFECTSLHEIVARQIHVARRDTALFDAVTLEVFEALGTLTDFTSLYAPVQVDGRSVGMICLENFSRTDYSPLSVRTLKFYAQMMSSYYAYLLNQERITQVHLETVAALVSAIEINDPYTEGHGRRVSYYAARLASDLGLTHLATEELRTAGLLHDIGKLGIPTGILNKPGTLLKEEFAQIQQHPEGTRRILENIQGLKRVRDLTYCHHERHDGTGYPLGLAGDAIPRECQILSIADAFDAMTSDRAYRKAMAPEQAADVILQEAGRQFHPDLARDAAPLLPQLYHQLTAGDL